MPRTPFGLIKSLDRGRSWHKLGLEGESDFHMLAASHGTNAVYVFNLLPNSRMRQVGLHYTLDDGRTWKRAEARSFERLVGGRQVLAVSFDLDGEKFWFSSVASRAKLWRIGLKAGGAGPARQAVGARRGRRGLPGPAPAAAWRDRHRHLQAQRLPEPRPGRPLDADREGGATR